MSNAKFEAALGTRNTDPFWRYSALLSADAIQQIPSQQTQPTALEQHGKLLLKREDTSVTGSHKWRSLAYQLSCLKSAGTKVAVLSSSGNAAISASYYAQQSGLKLFLFLSTKTPPAKLAALIHSPSVIPILSDRPLRLAKYAAAHFQLPDLRPSVDTNAVIGFQTLGYELYGQDSALTNIFTFVTSGASLRGIFNAYTQLVKLEAMSKLPRLYGVYSSGQLAGGLSARRFEQLEQLKAVCEASGGALVAVADSEIIAAQCELTNANIRTAAESAASLAAAKQMNPTGKTVVILTGRAWSASEPELSKFLRAENFAEVDSIITPHAS